MAHEVTDSNFDELIQSNNIVVVDFWAEWCGPCRMVAPILDELDKFFGDQVVIGKLNVDDNPDLGAIYAIQSVPTLVFFHNGAVRAKIVGMVSPKAILAKLNSLLPGNPTTKNP